MPQRRRWRSPPLPLPRRQHTGVEASQRTDDQEDCRVGCGVIDSCWDIAHSDGWLSRRAGVNVNLIIPRAIMSAEADGLRKGVDEF